MNKDITKKIDSKKSEKIHMADESSLSVQLADEEKKSEEDDDDDENAMG